MTRTIHLGTQERSYLVIPQTGLKNLAGDKSVQTTFTRKIIESQERVKILSRFDEREAAEYLKTKVAEEDAQARANGVPDPYPQQKSNPVDVPLTETVETSVKEKNFREFLNCVFTGQFSAALALLLSALSHLFTF